MNKLMSNNARIIEVILFIENESLSIESLSSLSKLSEDEVIDALKEIKEFYEDYGHGLELRNYDDDLFGFSPCSELYDNLKKTYGKKVDRRLSRAALETLAIIAYSQPITRKNIDKIRGVGSDSIVRLLREREYIKVVGRDSEPGHPCLYGTGRKFLFEFNLQSIKDLPRLSELEMMRFIKDKTEESLF